MIDFDGFDLALISRIRSAWYTDATCQTLKSDSLPPTMPADVVACPSNPLDSGTSEWCKEAYKVINLNLPFPNCGVPPSLPPSNDQCVAPTGGPDYGGSKWICLADGNGSGSYVATKLTAWNNAACLSRNSRDCVWSSKECCEKLIATADGSTPYFEVC